MKQLIVPIAIIVTLIAVFVIMDRKEFSRQDNETTIQSESLLTNRKLSASKAVSEKTEIETRHVNNTLAESKTIAEIKLEEKLSPFAVPVVTAEESRVLNEEALKLFNQRLEVNRKNRIISIVKTIATSIISVIVVCLFVLYLLRELRKDNGYSLTNILMIIKQNKKRIASIFLITSFAGVLLFFVKKVIPLSEDIVLSFAIMNRIGDHYLQEKDIKDIRIYYATDSDPVFSERQTLKRTDVLPENESLFKRELVVILPGDCTKVRLDLTYDTQSVTDINEDEYPEIAVVINGRKVQKEDYTINRWNLSSRTTFPVTISTDVLYSSPKTFHSVYFAVLFLLVTVCLIVSQILKSQRVFHCAFLVVFFSLSLFPTIKFNFEKESEQENRTLEIFPDIFYLDKASAYFSQLELWFNDRYFGREKLIAISDNIMTFFDDRGSERTLKGKDNWLFYRESLPETYIKKDFTEDKMSKAGEYLNSINKYAKKHGKVFLFVICPDKYRIYGDKTKYYSSDLYLNNTSTDQFVDYLRNHYEFPVIYSRKELLEKRTQLAHDLYFKYDTHWTQEGSYWGFYLPVVNTLAIEPIDVNWNENTSQGGDLINMLSSDKAKVANIEPQKYYKASFDRKASIEENDDPGNKTRKMIKAINPTGDKCALFYRDSFTTASVDLFSNTFQESIFLWRKPNLELDSDYLKQCDIIILESVERYVFSLSSLIAIDFGE